MKQYPFFKLSPCLIMVFSMVQVMFLSACMQSNAATQKPHATTAISEESVHLVNRAFRMTFIGGDWFYQGASISDDGINAYIQIPQKLDMTLSAQRDYLRQAICPSAKHNAMWQKLEDTPLSVHIYSDHKSMTVYAQCTNPLLS